jgi:transposase
VTVSDRGTGQGSVISPLLAKFQVHSVDAAGQVVISRKLKRPYVLALFQNLAPCLVGIE